MTACQPPDDTFPSSLARLTVDWTAVAREAAAALEACGVDPPGELWNILLRAEETGNRPAVESVIAEHERDGARRSTRLPAADRLADRDGDRDGEAAAGVCSLNCADACHIALERHELAGQVDAVVGRDTVTAHKPNPEPLLATVRALGVVPEDVLFVGDSDRDDETARRAGIRFAYVEDWLQRA